MDELSLLVWLSRGSKKTLIELMCNYTGCGPEVYTNTEIINLFENALIDISRKYYIKSLLYEYFSARHRWKDYALFYPKKYTEIDAEIDALGSAIFSIQPKIFDEEDLNIIKELKKEYMEEESNGEKLYKVYCCFYVTSTNQVIVQEQVGELRLDKGHPRLYFKRLKRSCIGLECMNKIMFKTKIEAENQAQTLNSNKTTDLEWEKWVREMEERNHWLTSEQVKELNLEEIKVVKDEQK